MRKLVILLAVLTLTVPLLFYGCSGDDGSAGTSAPTTGTISGTVTDNSTSVLQPNPGVSVWWTQNQGGASVPAQTTTTDASGNYSLTNVPIGGVYVYMSKPFYKSPGGIFVGVGGGTTTQVNALMSEADSGKPSITIAAQAADNSYKYGATVIVATSVNYSGLTDPNDNVSTLTYKWENATSPKKTSTGVEYGKVVGNTGAAANTAQVTFPTLEVAFSPRPSATQPGADVSGYKIPNQFGVMPIFPDTRGSVSVKLTVTDPKGLSFSPPNLQLNAESIVAGLANVPQNTRIYMNGGDNASYNWTGTAPGGGAIAFDNATIRTPSFRASAAGKYTVSVNGKSMDIYASKFAGLIANGTVTGDLMKDGTATDISTTAGSCNICHSGGPGGNQLPTWVKTRHAKIFTLNITTNIDPPGESRTCIYCHSVGYDEGVPGGNGGFAEKMYAFDNLFFPYGVYFGNTPSFWDNLFSTPAKKDMAQMANIQCENCHGPNNSAHTLTGTSGVFASPRVGFSAEVCAQCHGRTSHNFYSQWTVLGTDNIGHSNRAAAVGFAASAGSCARCHSAQGFTIFVDHLESGNFGNVTKAEYEDQGVTVNNVEPITCTACHDPHEVAYLKNPDGTPKINPETGRQETSNQLRVYNDTALLPAGFRVTGFGKGALCVTCHNTRNGAQTGSTTLTYLHEDGETYNGGNPTGYSAPHLSAQGDVFAGRNAYFMGVGALPMISRHAAIEETCVNCHMVKNPTLRSETVKTDEFGDPIYKRTSKSHTFRIDNTKGLTSFCSNCHGEDLVNGEAIQASIETGLADLAEKVGAAAKLKINDNTINAGVRWVRAYNAATDLYSSADPDGTGPLVAPSNVTFDVHTNPVVSVELEEGHGQVEFHITLTTAISITWTDGSTTSTKEFGVQLGSLQLSNTTDAASQTPLYGVATSAGPRPGASAMYRACWNYFLIHSDKSKGIHNPTFARQVLNISASKDLSN